LALSHDGDNESVIVNAEMRECLSIWSTVRYTLINADFNNI